MLLAAIDEMPTNEPPPPRTISRAACLSTYMVPLTLRSTVRRQASESIWVIGPMVSRAARAVHHAVQPAVPGRRRVHRAGGLLLVGDVGGLIANRAGGLERLRSL